MIFLRRYALKIFYIGSEYYGFQRQPGLKTIEGTLLDNLKETVDFKFWAVAGRTDKGVSAIGNVIAFTTAQKVILPAINAHLPEDIKIWAKAIVPENFHPRYDALYRHYRYICPYDGEDINKIKEGAEFLVGTHNFKNLCKSKIIENTTRTIEKITIGRDERGLLVFNFIGNAFLWKMIRKIVKVVIQVGKGEISFQELRNLLNPNYSPQKGIEPMPAEGLILYDVGYPFDFNIDRYSIEKLLNKIRLKISEHFLFSEVFRQILSSFNNFR